MAKYMDNPLVQLGFTKKEANAILNKQIVVVKDKEQAKALRLEKVQQIASDIESGATTKEKVLAEYGLDKKEPEERPKSAPTIADEIFPFLECSKSYDKNTGATIWKVKNTEENYLTIMRKDPFYKGLRLNTLDARREKIPDDPHDPMSKAWNESDEAKSRHHIESLYGIYDKGRHTDALSMLFSENKYNPVVDALNELPPWDKVERAAEFLHKYCKTEDSEYVRFVSRVLFDGLYARSIQAGFKFDFVPVLIGKQGSGKSSIVSFLALKDEFYGELDTVKEPKAIEQILGKIVVEVGELLAIKGGTQEAVKAFITRQKDNYRIPYDRYAQDFYRRCILIGTTNDRQFLTDLTGNRRWLPVHVASDGAYIRKHEDEIRKYIKLCYSEAKYRFENGLASFVVPDELKEIVEDEQSAAMVHDEKLLEIEAWLEGKPLNFKVCVKMVWVEALKKSLLELTDKDSAVIMGLLRSIKCLDESDRRASPATFDKYGRQRYFTKVREQKQVYTELVDDPSENPFE